jgi:hypothetical protein
VPALPPLLAVGHDDDALAVRSSALAHSESLDAPVEFVDVGADQPRGILGREAAYGDVVTVSGIGGGHPSFRRVGGLR